MQQIESTNEVLPWAFFLLILSNGCSFLRKSFCMKESADYLAEAIHILPFLLVFFLVSLFFFEFCVSVVFRSHLLLTLNSKRQGRNPPGHTLAQGSFSGKKDKAIMTLYFFIVAVRTLLLIPLYLLAATKIRRIIFLAHWKPERWFSQFSLFLCFPVSAFFNIWARSCAFFAPLLSTPNTHARFSTPSCYFSWFFSALLSKTGKGALQ